MVLQHGTDHALAIVVSEAVVRRGSIGGTLDGAEGAGDPWIWLLGPEGSRIIRGEAGGGLPNLPVHSGDSVRHYGEMHAAIPNARG